MNLEPVWIIAALILAFTGGVLAGFRIGFRMGREDAELEAVIDAIAAEGPDRPMPIVITRVGRRMLREANALDLPRRAPKPIRQPSDPMRWVKNNGPVESQNGRHQVTKSPSPPQ